MKPTSYPRRLRLMGRKVVGQAQKVPLVKISTPPPLPAIGVTNFPRSLTSVHNCTLIGAVGGKAKLTLHSNPCETKKNELPVPGLARVRAGD